MKKQPLYLVHRADTPAENKTGLVFAGNEAEVRNFLGRNRARLELFTVYAKSDLSEGIAAEEWLADNPERLWHPSIPFYLEKRGDTWVRVEQPQGITPAPATEVALFRALMAADRSAY